MRASTLFALTLAVIVGLGVATAAKLGGFFSAPPAPVAAKKTETQILVAAKNLFAGDVIDASGVKVRALHAEELEEYQKNKDQYLPPVAQAAVLRITSKNIFADQPILKDNLKEMAKPEPLNTRLLPQMRAINLAVPKDRCAGGQIQTGDWVDVLLTSEIESNKSKVVRTACIAAKVRIISKRNTLWPVFAPLPDNKPVDFTLEMNPYRAALVETTRSKGEFTIMPLGAGEQKQLESQRERLLQSGAATAPIHFMTADSPEADGEEARVAAFNRGELTVNETDLIRIFGLTTPPPPLAAISVERVSGAQRQDPVVFAANGTLLSDGGKHGGTAGQTTAAERYPRMQAPSMFQFRVPDCPTCNANKGKKSSR